MLPTPPPLSAALFALQGDDKPKAPEPQAEIPYLSPIAAEDWTISSHEHGGPEVAVARSVRWPGAYCAYQLVKGGTEALASIYIGYGHDALGAPFKMAPPPAFEADPDEIVEQTDTPLADENEAFKAAKLAEVAEEAAALPDAEEGGGEE